MDVPRISLGCMLRCLGGIKDEYPIPHSSQEKIPFSQPYKNIHIYHLRIYN
jgi:hypothetical protein